MGTNSGVAIQEECDYGFSNNVKSDLSGLIPMIARSQFTTYFVAHNNLTGSRFRAWHFHPGMTFNSMDKWWGDFKKRPRSHEGLDLCHYKDMAGNIRPVSPASGIPAMYSGKVVGIIDDFLGQSVILEHDEAKRFCTIYAHTRPAKRLVVGDRVREGDVLAFVADVRRSASGMLPHVHITTAWVTGNVSYETLAWPTLADEPHLDLFDPLLCIDLEN